MKKNKENGMSKKGGLTTFQNYLIGGIIGCIVLLAGMLYINLGTNYYGVTSPDIARFNTSFAGLNEGLTNTTFGLQGSLNSTLSGSSFLDALIGKTYLGMQAIGTSIDFIGFGVQQFSNMIGIDPRIGILIIAIPIIIIIFAIWMALLRVPF